jgi:hypothetical protein
VRYPVLLPLVRRAIKLKWMYRPYLVLSMLHAEYLVAEQAKIYAHAQGLAGRATGRGSTSSTASRRRACCAPTRSSSRSSSRASRASRHQIQVRLQMGDERVVAHMD